MSAVQTYMTTSIETESRGRIVVLLYDGAIQFLLKAREALQHQDHASKNKWIAKARDIILELNQVLDLEAGGELAQNLRSLYNFLWRYLGEVNMKNDVQMLEKAIGILDDLSGAWRKIAQ